jgi:hypothetical protein
MATTLHDPSSNGVFDGIPFLAAAVQDFDSETVLTAAITSVLKHGNKSLKADLLADNDWREYANSVRIDWDGSELVYLFEGSDAAVAAMTALEYGTEDAATSPVLRKHAFRLKSSDVSKEMDKVVNEVVGLG